MQRLQILKLWIKLSKVVAKASPAVKSTIAKVSKKAAILEAEVDEIADKVNELGSDMIGDANGTTVTIDYQYSNKVSRLFIFRCLPTSYTD